MSQQRTYTIICPHCEQEQDVQLYESLNVEQTPSLKDQLLRNELNTVTCPACESRFRVDKPLLYSDLTHGFMIYWIPADSDTMEEGTRQFRESLSRLTAALPEGLDLPEVYLVFTRTELVELIFLLEAQLDDRIVEYIKYTIYSQNLSKLDPTRKILLFDAEDSTAESLCFVVQDMATKELEGMLQYDRDAYEALCEMFDQDDQTANLITLFPGPHISARSLLLKEG